MQEIRYKISVVIPVGHASEFLKDVFTKRIGGVSMVEQKGCWVGSSSIQICEQGTQVFCAYSNLDVRDKLLMAIAFAGYLARQESLFIEEYSSSYSARIISPRDLERELQMKGYSIRDFHGYNCGKCGNPLLIKITGEEFTRLSGSGSISVQCNRCRNTHTCNLKFFADALAE